jgi:cation:H+ antiporter
MWIQLLLLVIGLALLVKGGDLFVAAAVRIAGFMRMPQVVIGSTLVSLATTTPELVVSIMAGTQGEPGLAVGNAVGSCICNVALVLGLTAAIKHVDVHPPALRTPLIAMFGVGALLFLMTLDLELSRWQGFVLIAVGLLYFCYDFAQHARNRRPEIIAEAEAIANEEMRQTWFGNRWGSAAQFLIGGGIVVVGSRLLVGAALNLAGGLGIPPIIIGLTVVSIGTSLPELVTAITSSRKNVSDLAVGNVLGANIANLTLITGTAAVISNVRLDRVTQLFNFPALLIVFGLLLWMLQTDRRVTRREGSILLMLYSIYISGIVILTVTLRK